MTSQTHNWKWILLLCLALFVTFGVGLFILCGGTERFRPIQVELADVRKIIDKNGGPEELNRQIAEYFRQVRANRSNRELLQDVRRNAGWIPAIRGIGLTSSMPPSMKIPGAEWFPESIKIMRGGHRNTVFIYVFDPSENFTPDLDRYVEVCKNVYMHRYGTQKPFTEDDKPKIMNKTGLKSLQ